MEKTESPKPEGKSENNLTQGIKSKLSGFSTWLYGVTKFILGILLLPFVYTATVAFLNELHVIDQLLQDYFWAGIITLVIIHLIIWEPQPVFVKGHKILESVFSFFQPLVKVAPYLLPIYTIVLFCLYLLLSLVIKSPDLLAYFIFFLGFSVSLHLVFSARTLRSKKGDFLKGNYIFGFSLVYLLNLGIICFFFSLIFDKFSFVNFSNQAFGSAKEIFKAVFTQLFIVSK